MKMAVAAAVLAIAGVAAGAAVSARTDDGVVVCVNTLQPLGSNLTLRQAFAAAGANGQTVPGTFTIPASLTDELTSYGLGFVGPCDPPATTTDQATTTDAATTTVAQPVTTTIVVPQSGTTTTVEQVAPTVDTLQAQIDEIRTELATLKTEVDRIGLAVQAALLQWQADKDAGLDDATAAADARSQAEDAIYGLGQFAPQP